MIDTELQNQSPKRTLTQWLFNPFQFIAGSNALLLGVLIMLAAAYIGSWSNTHFDGVLDVHSGLAAPLWVFFVEVIIDWLCISITLFIVALLASRSSFRVIDVFGTQALARAPHLITVLVTLPKGSVRFGKYLAAKATNQAPTITIQSTDVIFFIITAIVSLVMIAWVAVLMYRAYRVSCNLKGGKAIISFITALVVAEVLSKIAIWQLALGTG